jgi:hypothetical protein
VNEDVFNVAVRQFLKKFGITAQREIERAVQGALQSGRLQGNEKLQAEAVLRVDGLPGDIRVDGEIALE